jgi:3-hydroxyacyl-[acyl-carrier-protein] dehydratase
MIKSSPMNPDVCRVIKSDHPSLPGHFPDSPIVPGVVILDEVLAALMEHREELVVETIRAVKFLAPLKPDQPFTIGFSGTDQDGIDFCCRTEDQVIVEGRLQIARQKSSTS